MPGMNKFSDKDRRKQRRLYERNRIAQDLGSPKYRQQIKERKRAEEEDDVYAYWEYDEDEE